MVVNRLVLNKMGKKEVWEVFGEVDMVLKGTLHQLVEVDLLVYSDQIQVQVTFNYPKQMLC